MIRDGTWDKKDFISILLITKSEMECIDEVAKVFDRDIPDEEINPKFLVYRQKESTLLEGKNMASLFYEPSTRTRLSYHEAMKELGGKVNGFSVGTGSSEAKGETIYDTIKMVEVWADVIVMRTRTEGAALRASEITHRPVHNAGDGSNQHPSQTALDRYTIKKEFGTLENLIYTFAGDLKYGRTNRSLLDEISRNNPKEINLISHPIVPMSDDYLDMLRDKNIPFYQYFEKEKLAECIIKSDVVYISRPQEERFVSIDPKEKDEILNFIVLTASMLKDIPYDKQSKSVKPIILHPLPRKNEIHINVDNTPFARYFKQAANGIPVRKALLCLTMGVIR